jgi:hypothetical protein
MRRITSLSVCSTSGDATFHPCGVAPAPSDLGTSLRASAIAAVVPRSFFRKLTGFYSAQTQPALPRLGYDPAVTADIWFYLFPLYILGGLLLLLGTFALLGRIQGGRYLKPIINFMMKLPLVGRLMKKASQAALERQNPELASAVKKLERSGVARDPMRAQQALSRLSASERQAYLDATADQTENIAQNRQMRRQLERARKGKRR